jgi:hypothetical protein
VIAFYVGIVPGVKRIALVFVALGVLVVGVMTVLVLTSDSGEVRHPVSLDSNQPPKADGRQLTVVYLAGSADYDFRAEIHETADDVTVAITALDGCANLSKGEACNASETLGRITVTLVHPLGDRAVIDANAA